MRRNRPQADERPESMPACAAMIGAQVMTSYSVREFYGMRCIPYRCDHLLRVVGRPPELLAQALHGPGLATDAQERALGVGAFLEHLAGREDLPAHVLRRPGKEELSLDEVSLEERGDRLVQLRDICLTARAHHDGCGKP